MSTFQNMSRFHYEKLMDLFGARYSTEFGMLKIEEIASKVNNSNKLNQYITIIGVNSEKPSHQGIISTLLTIPYFTFSKGETLCIAALLSLTNWNATWNSSNEILEEDDLTEIVIDIIRYCYNTKFSKSNSIFSRFFKDINDLSTEDFWS